MTHCFLLVLMVIGRSRPAKSQKQSFIPSQEAASPRRMLSMIAGTGLGDSRAHRHSFSQLKTWFNLSQGSGLLIQGWGEQKILLSLSIEIHYLLINKYFNP